MPHKYTPEERISAFWSKVDKSGGVDGCWVWTASKSKLGYGFFGWDSRVELSHRVAWRLTHGSIPDGLCVLHDCPDGDNPSCVNPAHLWLGTKADNNADRDRKGRTVVARGHRSGRYTRPDRNPFGERNGSHTHPESRAFGERNGNAKLSNADAQEVRRRFAVGNTDYKELARQYNVTPEAIGNIIRKRTFKHV